MGAALALGARGLGRTWPNPNVGCVLVRDGRVVGRGWTQPAGRPHAEAMAVAEAGDVARGATAYVTLEPCAAPGRGPACADVLIAAGVARVVAALRDPFPAVDGRGFAKLRDAGIDVVEGVGGTEAARSMTGFLTRQRLGRPHVTLKLALSLDGAAARHDGQSKWITGAAARAHVHVQRACADAILVGRATWETDNPVLDVRLPGLGERSPSVVILSGSRQIAKAEGEFASEPLRPLVRTLETPSAISELAADRLFVEGGMTTAASFLGADLVDRLLLYRAPVLIGGGRTLGDIGLSDLADAHGRWLHLDSRRLGIDTLDVYERVRG